jgi:hypothetical protein
VISSPTVDDFLRRAFAPSQRGIVGLTEQLLGACVGGDAAFERIGDRCVCRWTVSGETQEATVPLPPAAFRTLLARLAALCNERTPHSVSPYGGQGELSVGNPPAILKVRFVNTSEQQKLELTTEPEHATTGPLSETVIDRDDAEKFLRASTGQPL